MQLKFKRSDTGLECAGYGRIDRVTQWGRPMYRTTEADGWQQFHETMAQAKERLGRYRWHRRAA